MLCKNAASAIVGTSMGQEICLIHGQVSHNLLYWKKPSWRIYVVRVEINKTTAYIQARSFSARTLGKMGKNATLKEKQKWSNEKLHLENAGKLRGIYFIDPEEEFRETIKNARKKLETSVAPAMPCNIMTKNCGSGGSNKVRNKTCVYSGSWWIYETAYGKFDAT